MPCSREAKGAQHRGACQTQSLSSSRQQHVLSATLESAELTRPQFCSTDSSGASRTAARLCRPQRTPQRTGGCHQSGPKPQHPCAHAPLSRSPQSRHSTFTKGDPAIPRRARCPLARLEPRGTARLQISDFALDWPSSAQWLPKCTSANTSGKCRSIHSSVGPWMQCCREVTTTRSHVAARRCRLWSAPARRLDEVRAAVRRTSVTV